MHNTKITCTLAWCAALTFAVSASGQETSTEASRKPGDLDAIRKVSTLIGTPVMNHANTKIAVLRDLAISPEGEVVYGIIGWGGLAGVAESYSALPYDMLGVRLDEGKWAVNLDLSSDDLEQAPLIKSENYRELIDPQWISQVDQFVRTRGASVHHPERSAGAVKDERGRSKATPQRVLLATKIRAASFKNTRDEELGKVEDLLLDRKKEVAFLIIGRGGVLGIGENYVPVPWSLVGLGEKRSNAAVTIAVDATKGQLEKAPLVKGSNYATLLAPGFPDQVRAYFRTIAREGTKTGDDQQP